MGMTPAIDITAEQRRTVLALLNRYLPDTTAWACGSRVKWTSRAESDLDLVVFARPEQGARVAELREAFEESDLPFRVDLFVWDEVPERFKARIEGDHVVLTRDNPGRKDNKGSRWRRCRIDDVAEKVAMGPFGSSIKVETFTPSGVPIISGQHLHGSRVDDKPGFNFISEAHAERLRGANVRKGDIIFTHAGNIGQVACIPENSKYDRYVVSQRQFYMRPKPSEVIPEFIVAYFKTPEGQHELLANASQVGVPSIARPVTYLRSIEIPTPPIQEQRDIAHILGTLDDKIELNRRMNETLEAIAQSLFKSWFVDFDPVSARMEVRGTGLPKSLADLFPDRLVDSECGEIPEGWKAGRLADIAIAPGRNVDPANLDDETPYIGLEHMPRRSIALAAWGSVGKVTSNKSAFNTGEVLFGKLRPYFHKVGVAPINGVCSTDIVVIASKAVEWSAFVLACVSSVEFVSYTNQSSTGTKMPRTNWTTMGDYRICLPATPVAKVFQNVVQPMLGRIAANVHESRTLTALRDTLLPKLISGEIRFHDAARQTENVA